MRSDLPVKEVMTSVVCTVGKDDTVHTLAKKLVEYGVGSAVVVDGDTPIGIVTEKDLISKIVARNRLPSEVRIEDVMTHPIITINPNTSLREATRIMIRRGIRRLPVVNEKGRLVGIITDNDILGVSLDLEELAALITENSIGYPEPPVKEDDTYAGICEKCGKYSDRLVNYNGLRLCEDCVDTES